MHLLAYDLPKAVEAMLLAQGCTLYPVESADDLSDAIRTLPKNGKMDAGDIDIDAVIVGVDGDADEITLREIRHARYLGPVIVFTEQSVGHHMTLLTQGATVVMSVHTDAALVYAQVEALVLFSNRMPVGVKRVGGLILDMQKKVVVRENGERIHLTGKEYAMFELLMLRRGMTLTKDNFLDHLYGGRDEPETKIIDVFICKLRKKLSSGENDQSVIETVWGRGYFIPHEKQVQAQAVA